MDSQTAISIISQKTLMVHAGDPGAYDAFVTGKLIFDVCPGAPLLERFANENAAEFFGEIIVRDRNGHFCYIDVPNCARAWFTYHKHTAQEAAIPERQQIEGPE